MVPAELKLKVPLELKAYLMALKHKKALAELKLIIPAELKLKLLANKKLKVPVELKA